jgi:hypothetical protein
MTMCLLRSVMLASRTASHVVVRRPIAIPSPSPNSSRIHLLSGRTGVIHVVTAVIPQKEIRRK